MKKLALVSLVLLLNGCVLVDAFRMSRFDNNEYMLVNQIRTQSQLGTIKCGTKDVVPYVDDIYVKSVELRNYSAGIAHNEEAVTMATNLLDITRGFKEKYANDDDASQKFCELKFSMIEKSTAVMQTTIGAKPR